MCLRAIYIFPGSVHILPPAEKAGPSWEYIIRSQTHECGNWDWGPDIPFLGIFVSNFRHFVFAVQELSNLYSHCGFSAPNRVYRRNIYRLFNGSWKEGWQLQNIPCSLRSGPLRMIHFLESNVILSWYSALQVEPACFSHWSTFGPEKRTRNLLCGRQERLSVSSAISVPEFIDPVFAKTIKPKTLVFSHRKRAFLACFRENWVNNFGHRYFHITLLSLIGVLQSFK
jgi:hypothetical protein